MQKTLSILSRSREANKTSPNFSVAAYSKICEEWWLDGSGDETSATQLPLLREKFFANMRIEISFEV